MLPSRFLATILLALAACSHVAGPPPHVDPQGWSRVRSAHFDLLSDAPDSRQEDVSRELESVYAVIHDNFFRKADLPRIEVLLFQDTGYLHEVFGDDIGALFLHRLDGADGPVVLLANYPSMDESQMTTASWQHSIVAHELTHMFIDAAARGAPSWFHEGLASYLETVEVRGETAWFGELPRDMATVLAEGRWVPLATMANQRFMNHSGIEMATHYATAWAYLHYILNAEHGALMPRYLRIWATLADPPAGVPIGLATLQAPFPELSLDELDNRVRDYAVSHLTGARAAVGAMKVDVPRAALESPLERAAAERAHVRQLCSAVYAMKGTRKR